MFADIIYIDVSFKLIWFMEMPTLSFNAVPAGDNIHTDVSFKLHNTLCCMLISFICRTILSFNSLWYADIFDKDVNLKSQYSACADIIYMEAKAMLQHFAVSWYYSYA